MLEVYKDDMIVKSDDASLDDQYLDKVFQRVQQNNMTLDSESEILGFEQTIYQDST